jgi:hypothetical protein
VEELGGRKGKNRLKSDAEKVMERNGKRKDRHEDYQEEMNRTKKKEREREREREREGLEKRSKE